MPQPRRAASQPGVSAVPSSAHAEPGWTREELSGNHAAREDQGRGKPSCTPLYTHRSVTARNGQNSSSPSTSVDIPAAPHRASRLTLHSLLLRSTRPTRRGRPSRRCCAPSPGSSVNRTPHETRDHPTVAPCRTAENLRAARCGRARIAAWLARRSCPLRDVPAVVGTAADLLQILTVVAALR